MNTSCGGLSVIWEKSLEEETELRAYLYPPKGVILRFGGCCPLELEKSTSYHYE